MKDMADAFPGMDRIRTRFLELLEVHQAQIAAHALAAWDGETLEDINDNLTDAQNILKQIAGSAGSMGYPHLGKAAKECALEITNHLEGPDADLAICPGEMVFHADNFVSICRDLIDTHG